MKERGCVLVVGCCDSVLGFLNNTRGWYSMMRSRVPIVLSRDRRIVDSLIIMCMETPLISTSTQQKRNLYEA